MLLIYNECKNLLPTLKIPQTIQRDSDVCSLTSILPSLTISGWTTAIMMSGDHASSNNWNNMQQGGAMTTGRQFNSINITWATF